MKKTFNEVIDTAGDISNRVDVSGRHIRATRSSLLFLGSLEQSLHLIIVDLTKAREQLLPWQDRGTHDSEEVEKLKERYSMAQERMIHVLEQPETEAEELEEDFFF